MGALLGFAVGAGLGAAGNQAKQKQAKEQQHDEMMLQTYQQHPDLATTDSAQQFLKKKYGADTAEMFGMLGKHYSQLNQQFGADLQSGGGTSSPAAASPSGTAAPASQGDPMQQHMDQVSSEIQRMQGLQTKYQNDPSKLAIIKQKLEFLTKQSEQFSQQQQQSQQKSEDRAQRDEFHQDSESDKAASREQAKALTEATQAQAKANADFQHQFETQGQQLKKMTDDETRQTHIATMAKGIDGERDKLLQDFAKLPDAAKPAAEARVKGYNSSAAMFYQKHASAGAPTLLKFTAGTPGSGLRGYPTGQGAVAPTIEAVPPSYVSYKGQAGWMDGDNNFYPESDAPTDTTSK